METYTLRGAARAAPADSNAGGPGEDVRARRRIRRASARYGSGSPRGRPARTAAEFSRVKEFMNEVNTE